MVEGGVDRLGLVGVAVVEQHVRRQRHRDEVRDLRVQRRGQPGGETPDDGVGLRRLRVDRQRPARFEVDEHLPPVAVDAELGERDARHPDPPRRLAEQLDRNPGGQMPHVVPLAGPRRGRDLIARQRERDLALGRHLHDDDLHAGVDEVERR